MAYAARQPGAQRTTTILFVAAIHLLAGVVLVNQFAPPDFIPSPIHRVEAFFYSEPTKPSPPAPKATATSDSTDSVTYVPPKLPSLPPRKPIEIASTSTLGPLVDVDVFQEPPVLVDVQPPGFTPRAARPANAIAGWATTNDYPSMSIKLEEQGVSKFRVTVGTDGRVEACEILRSSGHARLDAATCKLVTGRARFNPATDSKGEKIVGTYTNSISWVLPR